MEVPDKQADDDAQSVAERCSLNPFFQEISSFWQAIGIISGSGDIVVGDRIIFEHPDMMASGRCVEPRSVKNAGRKLNCLNAVEIAICRKDESRPVHQGY